EYLRHGKPHADIQGRFGTIYGRLGDLFLNEQDWPAAFDYYDKARAKLEDVEAINVAYRRELGLVYGRLGKVRFLTEKFQEARDYYAKALNALNRLPAQSSLDPRAVRVIVDVHGDLGATCMKLGRIKEARLWFREAVLTWHKLAQIDAGTLPH